MNENFHFYQVWYFLYNDVPETINTFLTWTINTYLDPQLQLC